MNAPFNTPQAVADELLRVDQARRIRIMEARTEARRVWGPLSLQRDRIEAAMEQLQSADVLGASVADLVERCADRLAELQHEIDEAMRAVALKHRLFVNEDEIEDFDEVDVDRILPAGEAARRQMMGRSR